MMIYGSGQGLIMDLLWSETIMTYTGLFMVGFGSVLKILGVELRITLKIAKNITVVEKDILLCVFTQNTWSDVSNTR